jgi:hypothetical protein
MLLVVELFLCPDQAIFGKPDSLKFDFPVYNGTAY